MLIAHLSDLHLQDARDLRWLERQLDQISGRAADHLAVTGDVLDRWDADLLEAALDAFGARGLMDRERLTILHGNHDLASSGGHPQRGADLWRLAFRFWDPPPLLALRRRRFYAAIARRAAGVAVRAPFLKTLKSRARIAVVDSVPASWRPLKLRGGTVTVLHAVGGVRTSEMAWLARQKGETPLIVLMHHYPLDAPQFTWTPERGDFSSPVLNVMERTIREVAVPMAIPEPDRTRFWSAAAAAGVRLILCGHVHRMRFEWHRGIGVGLNGQSGAAWARRTIVYYDVSDGGIAVDRGEML